MGGCFSKQAVIATLLICCLSGAACADEIANKIQGQDASTKNIALDEQLNLEKELQAVTASATTDLERCEAIWKVVWPLAKAGNKEARFGILMSVTLGHFGLAPNYRDKVSSSRIFLILALHSFGAQSLAKDAQRAAGTYPSFLSDYPFMKDDIKFAECVTRGQTPECARVAVDDHLIPSFDDFAKEIDALIEAGTAPLCKSVTSSEKGLPR